MQGHVVARSLGVMVFVQLSSGVQNISNCMVLGKHFWGSTVALRSISRVCG